LFIFRNLGGIIFTARAESHEEAERGGEISLITGFGALEKLEDIGIFDGWGQGEGGCDDWRETGNAGIAEFCFVVDESLFHLLDAVDAPLVDKNVAEQEGFGGAGRF
jgi:hypothetical protein